MKTEFRIASVSDARRVLLGMTDRHAAEIRALSHLEGYEMIEAAVQRVAGGVCIVADGIPVAAGKAITARPNVASLCLVTTDEFPPVALAFTRFLRNILFEELRRGGVHRIECVTMADFTAARRWIKLLGLGEEALLRKYGQGGEDFVQFAWVAE